MQGKFLEKNGILNKTVCYFPERVARSIMAECGNGRVLEIRLREGARSSVLLDTGIRSLPFILTQKEIGDILFSLCGGALYAHRDTLINGYITPTNGLRVGVCGKARYDGGKIVGVSEVRSLIFRIPHYTCSFEDRLYELWRSFGRGGFLIYSPPCGGKTTALRRLAFRIGKDGVRTAVVDERCEFLPEEYLECEVDILRGYKKSKGIEIAVRTLGSEVVIVDEIGASEAGEVLSSLTLGIPFIATAHAASAEEILTRPAFTRFIEAGAFETLVGIRRSGGAWHLEHKRIARNVEGRVKLSEVSRVI